MISIPKVKFVALALLVCASTLQVGCKDRDVGVAIVAAVATAAVMDATSRPEPRPRYYRCDIHSEWVCDTHFNRGWATQVCGYTDFNCHGERLSPNLRRRMSLSAPTSSISEISTASIAQTYGLSEAGASKLLAALSESEGATSDEQTRAAFAKIGINLDEVKDLGMNGTPSDDMIERAAKALGEDISVTKEMIIRMLESARSRQATRSTIREA